MRKLLAIALLISGTMFIVSCSDDEGTVAPTFDDPTVSISPTSSDVEFGATGQSVTFTVSVDADLTATWAATAGNTNVTVTTASGDVSGTSVVVSFDAAAAGLTSIQLTVTDSEGQTASASTAFNVLEEGDNGISISLIPATASIDFGADLATVPYQVDGLDGIASFTVSVNGGMAADFAAVTGDDLTSNPTSIGGASSTFTVPFATLQALGASSGNNTLIFVATDADGDIDEFTHVLTIGTPTTVLVTANVDADVTWMAGNVYELATRVIVEPGVTLTIEAGALIKGQGGDGANATALIVAVGGTLNANGTAAAPIIMTSTDDDIEPGQIVSPNLNETNSGLWGGLIVLGDAPISEETNTGTDNIEGVPAEEGLAVYGGDDADDNSGTITYVSVRHGGTRLGDGDEINGITFGGVGTGTTIRNIEVVGNLDDGMEWFGGGVDVDNALVWAADDDAIDIDQAYSGTIDNVIVVAFSGTDHCFEIDGPEGALAGSYTITNASAKGVDDEIANFRDGATGDLGNAYFFNFVSPTEDTNGAEEGGTGEGDFTFDGEANTATAYTDGDLTFGVMQITLAADATIANVFPDLNATDQGDISDVALGQNTVGADKSAFAWTFASQAGALDDFN